MGRVKRGGESGPSWSPCTSVLSAGATERGALLRCVWEAWRACVCWALTRVERERGGERWGDEVERGGWRWRGSLRSRGRVWSEVVVRWVEALSQEWSGSRRGSRVRCCLLHAPARSLVVSRRLLTRDSPLQLTRALHDPPELVSCTRENYPSTPFLSRPLAFRPLPLSSHPAVANPPLLPSHTQKACTGTPRSSYSAI